MDSNILIRAAVAADAPDLARLHVESWRESYRGVMSDERLDDPGFIERRERFWAAALTDERYSSNTVVTATLDGAIVGVAMCGPPSDDHATWAKQLYTYAAVHGRGAGSALLNAVVDPQDTVGLWVADLNPRAQAFYRKQGFVPDGTTKVEDGVREVLMIRDRQPPH